MTRTTNLIALAAAAAAALSATAPAYAETRSITLDVSAINLGTSAGQKTLDGMIRQAAETVCGYSRGVQPVSVKAQQRSCLAAATESAHTQIAMLEDGQSRGRIVVAGVEAVQPRPTR